ncbi:MAG: hypothetical protein IT374_10275 [Polyangiaceae bacterium]|nr:hypothetical protein [Polyangiaceae bacterium]
MFAAPSVACQCSGFTRNTYSPMRSTSIALPGWSGSARARFRALAYLAPPSKQILPSSAFAPGSVRGSSSVSAIKVSPRWVVSSSQRSRDDSGAIQRSARAWSRAERGAPPTSARMNAPRGRSAESESAPITRPTARGSSSTDGRWGCA